MTSIITKERRRRNFFFAQKRIAEREQQLLKETVCLLGTNGSHLVDSARTQSIALDAVTRLVTTFIPSIKHQMDSHIVLLHKLAEQSNMLVNMVLARDKALEETVNTNLNLRQRIAVLEGWGSPLHKCSEYKNSECVEISSKREDRCVNTEVYSSEEDLADESSYRASCIVDSEEDSSDERFYGASCIEDSEEDSSDAGSYGASCMEDPEVDSSTASSYRARCIEDPEEDSSDESSYGASCIEDSVEDSSDERSYERSSFWESSSGEEKIG